MPTPTIAALVPFTGAAPFTSVEGRRDLRRRGVATAARRLALRDLLASLVDAETFLLISVVSHDRTVRRLCRESGAHLLLPPPSVRGRVAELRWAALRAEVAGADRLLVAPPESAPFATSTLFRLALPPLERGVRVVTARAGVVDALLVAPPDLFATLPALRGGAMRVRRAARQAGVAFESFLRPVTDAAAPAPRRERRTGTMLIDPETLGLAQYTPTGPRRYAKRTRRRVSR